jgi:hypothetical protein
MREGLRLEKEPEPLHISSASAQPRTSNIRIGELAERAGVGLARAAPAGVEVNVIRGWLGTTSTSPRRIAMRTSTSAPRRPPFGSAAPSGVGGRARRLVKRRGEARLAGIPMAQQTYSRSPSCPPSSLALASL